MDIFRTIAERKIKGAIEEGAFTNLPGEGKPLSFEDETWIPEELRVAYRILKNAGFVPPDLELRNEIIQMRDLINRIDDDKERLKKVRELNYKIMCLDMLRRRPLNLRDHPEYEVKIVDKCISS